MACFFQNQVEGVQSIFGRILIPSSRREWGDFLDRTSSLFLYLFVAAIPFSISATEISAGLAGFALLVHGRIGLSTPARWDMAGVFGLFAAGSILSASFSLDPRVSFIDSKDLFHFLIFYIVLNQVNSLRSLDKFARVLIGAGGIAGLIGLGQTLYRGVDLEHRISGFNSIYMTYAGLLMLILCLASAYLVFTPGEKRNRWIWVSSFLMGSALVLSLTRSAWVGLLTGLILLLAARSKRLLLVLPVAALILLAAAPDGVRTRVKSIVNPNDYSTQERIKVWSSGLWIIRDFPLFGVGQNNFPRVYPDYRYEGVSEPQISHLHNNVLEIGVERGLMGLAVWIAIWVLYFLKSVRILGRLPKEYFVGKMMTLGSMAGVCAFLVAGMFEYNFGDAEIHILVYFLMAIPFVVDKVKPTLKIRSGG